MTIYDLHTLASIPYLYILYLFFILFSLMHFFYRNERFELFDIIFRRKWWIALPVSCVITCLLLCSNSSLVWMMGGWQDLRLAPDGTYCYYVVASREYTSKEYTLPARIEKTDGNYAITNVYFPNGGYLYFDSPEYTKIDEVLEYGDQDGELWDIKLTNNQTSHPKVYTNYSVGYFVISITIAGALVVFISMILYCFRIKLEPYRIKKLLNLILYEYDKKSIVYQEILSWGFASNASQKYDADEINYVATQAYYEDVFNAVCKKLSAKNSRFQNRCSVKICNIDTKKLHVSDVLDFSYDCLYNAKIDTDIWWDFCASIKHHVDNLKTQILSQQNK